ncbi:hypothetical protein PG996_011905 [Apiospora saccharicola]|uniref:Uncharacterized protein n=1 Tax=Apiospora saccharicola TaxID=335842 RepID=A0ABR1UGD7_9PEZI
MAGLGHEWRPQDKDLVPDVVLLRFGRRLRELRTRGPVFGHLGVELLVREPGHDPAEGALALLPCVLGTTRAQTTVHMVGWARAVDSESALSTTAAGASSGRGTASTGSSSGLLLLRSAVSCSGSGSASGSGRGLLGLLLLDYPASPVLLLLLLLLGLGRSAVGVDVAAVVGAVVAEAAVVTAVVVVVVVVVAAAATTAAISASVVARAGAGGSVGSGGSVGGLDGLLLAGLSLQSGGLLAALPLCEIDLRNSGSLRRRRTRGTVVMVDLGTAFVVVVVVVVAAVIVVVAGAAALLLALVLLALLLAVADELCQRRVYFAFETGAGRVILAARTARGFAGLGHVEDGQVCRRSFG